VLVLNLMSHFMHTCFFVGYIILNPVTYYNREINSDGYWITNPSIMQEVEWGNVNMIEAERRLLSNALLDISNQRFVLISESCIPLFNFSTIYSYLINSTQNYVMSYDDPSSVGRGRYSIQMLPEVSLNEWRKGSQWFEMDRELALGVVSDRIYFPVFQEYCKGSCYADEHYLPTLVRIKFGEGNSNRSLTWVDWSRGGPHPAHFLRSDVNVKFLERLRSKKCKYNNGDSTNACFLFARKFLPSTLSKLLKIAPKVMQFEHYDRPNKHKLLSFKQNI
jgi:hypothetical protein